MCMLPQPLRMMQAVVTWILSNTRRAKQ